METDYKLTSTDELTELAKSYGIETWNELTNLIKHLPYGRNKDRTNFELVLSEQKGTCSSKHAFLKSIADMNTIPNIDLIIGIYKMTESNTPKIGSTLTEHSIAYIPEAHCYLKINNNRIDLTSEHSEFKKIEKDIIHEIKIKPSQVAEFKVEYHKNFLKTWVNKANLAMKFDDIWNIREQCILNLTQ